MHLLPPVEQDLLLAWFAGFSCFGYRSRQPVSVETFVQVRLSAVQDFYKSRFFSRLSKGVRLDLAVAGYQRTSAPPGDRRLPLDPAILRRVHARLLARGSPWSQLVWGLCLANLFSAGRPGEFWGPFKPKSPHLLKWSDISFGYGTTPQRSPNRHTKWVDVHWRSSKADIRRAGERVRLHCNGGDFFSPIIGFRCIDRARRALGITDQDSFICDRGNGKLVSLKSIVAILKDEARRCGIDPTRITGHSFRIGTATQLFAGGHPEPAIMLMGRWKSDSVRRYIHLVDLLSEKINMKVSM